MENRNEENQLHRRNSAIILGITILVTITIAFSIYVFFLMRRRIIFPLAVLEEGAQAIKSGDYSRHIGLSSNDEIGVLSTAFNSMSHSIKENTSRLHATIESTTDGILVVDLDQKITTYNTRFLEIWHLDHKMAGTGDDEVLLNACTAQMENPKAFLERVMQLMPNSMRRLSIHSFYVMVGSLNAIRGHNSLAIRLSAGSGASGMFTERYRAKEELKKAKENAELLYKMIPSAVFTVDLEQRVTSWNDQAARITGYSAEEMLGRKCTEFAFFPCIQTCGLFSSDLTKPIFDRHCTIKTKDGRIRTISKNIDELSDNYGSVIGGIECFDDVTERLEIEQELQKLSQAVEQSPAIVVITDTEGTIEYVNPRFPMLTGYTAEEAIGRNTRILKSGMHTPDFYKENVVNHRSRECLAWGTLQSQEKRGVVLGVDSDRTGQG